MLSRQKFSGRDVAAEREEKMSEGGKEANKKTPSKPKKLRRKNVANRPRAEREVSSK
jgi:hypothetical protein